MNDMLFQFFFAPFADFAFMRRALAGGFALALGCGPVGVLLVLRRMSLIGDAMAHAVLPGAAIGFLVGGLSLGAMGLGGFVAGLSVALLAGAVSRLTRLKEDASFASFYLISLALGVLLVSRAGGTVDLMHMLFGSILAIDNPSLMILTGIAAVTLVALAAFYRPLVAECFDPRFLRALGVRAWAPHSLFLVLAVLNLVGGFQALGTLMAVGLLMLPAVAARYWASEVWSLFLVASLLAFMSSYAGLLVSFHADLASGPCIVLAAGAGFLLSLGFGPRESLARRWLRRRHLSA